MLEVFQPNVMQSAGENDCAADLIRSVYSPIVRHQITVNVQAAAVITGDEERHGAGSRDIDLARPHDGKLVRQAGVRKSSGAGVEVNRGIDALAYRGETIEVGEIGYRTTRLVDTARESEPQATVACNAQ